MLSYCTFERHFLLVTFKMNFVVVSAAPTGEEGKIYHAIGKPEETLVIIVFPCRLGIHSKRHVIVTKVEPLDISELKYFGNFGVLICDFGQFLIGKASNQKFQSKPKSFVIETSRQIYKYLSSQTSNGLTFIAMRAFFKYTPSVLEKFFSDDEDLITQ